MVYSFKKCFQAAYRIRQPETFAKPKNAQETVNSPSFPRKWESWLSLCNELFLRKFLNIKQDFRLRGNDGELTISCGVFRFCKGFSLKIKGRIIVANGGGVVDGYA